MDAQPPNGYFDAATLATIFDMPRESFLQTVRRNIRAAGFEHRIGPRVYFRASDVYAYLVNKAVSRAIKGSCTNCLPKGSKSDA